MDAMERAWNAHRGARSSTSLLARWAAGIRLLLLLVAVPQSALAAPEDISPELLSQSSGRWAQAFLDDANLYDVCFVDRDLGWAVGDRGVIWQTKDGGVTWAQQLSNVTCRLESVSFVDAKRGWVVGGETSPFTHRPSAVILKTEDGGATWKRYGDALLPWLKGVRFHDRQHGFAYGWPSTMFPSGLFRTSDGGLHWSAVAGYSKGWIRGEFDEQGTGLLIDRSGKISLLTQGELREGSALPGEARFPVGLVRHADGQWTVCGNQGLVSWTDASTQKWHVPSRLPSAPSLQEFDWQAIAHVGSEIWIAGVPGTQVLYSSDGGQSFEFRSTGQRLPLFAITFADAERGWAVGAMGIILHTRDGGRSWLPQRAEGRRLAALGVFARTTDIPWDGVTQLSSIEGHRISLEVFGGSAFHQAQIGSIALSTRLHEAAVWAGGVGANLLDGLHLPEERLQLGLPELRERWAATGHSDLDRQLTEYLVRQIRIWQPEMIITRDAMDDAADGWNLLVKEVVQQAVEQAAIEHSDARTMDAIGLSPWRVARVAALTPAPSTRGGYTIQGQRVVLSRGESVGALADQAQSHLSGMPVARQATWTLRGVARNDQERLVGGSSSVRLSADPRVLDATRRTLTSLDNDVRKQNQRLQQYRHIESLMRNKSSEGLAASTQILHLANELDFATRGHLLYDMGVHFLSLGQGEPAFACWEPFRHTLAEHPRAEAARLQLFWLLASEEASMQWRFSSTRPVERIAQTTTMEVEDGKVRAVTFDDPDIAEAESQLNARFDASVRPASSDELPRDSEAEARPKAARQLAEMIQSRQPDLYFEPELGFALAALQQRTNQRDAAAKFWKNQLSGRTEPAYRTWANSELALAGERPLQTRSVWNCVPLEKPPRLDGMIEDDPAWSRVVPQSLHSDARWTVSARDVDRDASDELDAATTQVWFAYDREFLYLAARCEDSPAPLQEAPARGSVTNGCQAIAWNASSTWTAMAARSGNWPSTIAVGPVNGFWRIRVGIPPGTLPGKRMTGNGPSKLPSNSNRSVQPLSFPAPPGAWACNGSCPAPASRPGCNRLPSKPSLKSLDC